MLKRYAVTTAVAVMSAAVALGAQAPQGADQPRPAQESASQAERPQPQGDMTTLVGCVYEEQDVPGRTPNVAEKAGVLEDYILADARPASSAKPGSDTAVGTSGAAAAMYKLEQIDDEKLRAVVGKRVEVTGRIDREAGDQPAGAAGAAGQDRSLGPDQIELPEFEVTSIREVEGTCPAAPAATR